MKRFLNVTVITVFGISYGLFGAAFGYGNGDVTIHLNGGDDVAYIGEVNTLEIWIANDAMLMGMLPAIEITFATALTWDMGYGDHPPVNEEGRAINCWNLPDLMVSQDFNNVSPDHLMVAGASMPGMGLPAGASELCYTLQFSIPAGEPETNNGISIVPYLYPPSGTWTFYDDAGNYPPDFNGNPVADEYNPVAPPATFDIVRRIPCGDVNCDYTVSIADAVYIINYIFKGGPAPCANCP